MSWNTERFKKSSKRFEGLDRKHFLWDSVSNLNYDNDKIGKSFPLGKDSSTKKSTKSSGWESLYKSPLMPKPIAKICRKLEQKKNFDCLNNLPGQLTDFEFTVCKALPDQCDLSDKRCRCDLQKMIIDKGLEYIANVGGFQCDRNGNVVTNLPKNVTKTNAAKNFIQYNKNHTKPKLVSKHIIQCQGQHDNQSMHTHSISNNGLIHLNSPKCGIETTSDLQDMQNCLQRSRLRETFNVNIQNQTSNNVIDTESRLGQLQIDEDDLLATAVNGYGRNTLTRFPKDERTNDNFAFQPIPSHTSEARLKNNEFIFPKPTKKIPTKIMLGLNSNNYNHIERKDITQPEKSKLYQNTEFLQGRSYLMKDQNLHTKMFENQNYIHNFYSKESSSQLPIRPILQTKNCSDKVKVGENFRDLFFLDRGDKNNFGIGTLGQYRSTDDESSNRSSDSSLSNCRRISHSDENREIQKCQTKKKLFRKKKVKKNSVNAVTELFCARQLPSSANGVDNLKNPHGYKNCSSKGKNLRIQDPKAARNRQCQVASTNETRSVPLLKVCNVLNEKQNRLKINQLENCELSPRNVTQQNLTTDREQKVNKISRILLTQVPNKTTQSEPGLQYSVLDEIENLSTIQSMVIKESNVESSTNTLTFAEPGMKQPQGYNLNLTSEPGLNYSNNIFLKEETSTVSSSVLPNESISKIPNNDNLSLRLQTKRMKAELLVTLPILKESFECNSASSTDDEEDEDLPEIFKKKRNSENVPEPTSPMLNDPLIVPISYETILEKLQLELKYLANYRTTDNVLKTWLDKLKENTNYAKYQDFG